MLHVSFDDNLDDSLYSSNEADGGYNDDDELLDFDEAEDYCVADMKGLRFFSVENLEVDIQEKKCCKSCTFLEHKKYIKDFLDFTEQ